MKAFWRYFWLFQCGWNYERMQSVGYCYTDKCHPEEAAPQSGGFQGGFPDRPQLLQYQPGSGYSVNDWRTHCLEEAGAPESPPKGLKVGLMGPLAGVGDTLVWALYNSIVFSIGASLALGGSVLGPILVLLLVSFPYLAVRYWQFAWAYKQGANLIASLGGGMIAEVTEFATIVGLVVDRRLCALSIVRLTVAWTPTITSTTAGRRRTVTTTINIQQQLDAILPYMLPVLVTALAYFLLKRGWSPVAVLGVLFVIGFIGGAIGLFA